MTKPGHNSTNNEKASFRNFIPFQFATTITPAFAAQTVVMIVIRNKKHGPRETIGTRLLTLNPISPRYSNGPLKALTLPYAVHVILRFAVLFRHQPVNVGLEAGELRIEVARKLQIVHNGLVETLARNQ